MKPLDSGFRNWSAVGVSVHTGDSDSLKVELMPLQREVQINAVELFPTTCQSELILAVEDAVESNFVEPR